MDLHHELIYGSLLEYNEPPADSPHAPLHISGTFKGIPRRFGISLDMLSKHILLVGGTGCGKTTLFYHFVRQLKQNLKPKDVMLIFDSKGDFLEKFHYSGDIVIGNSPQYRKISECWNIYNEAIADGMDKDSVFQNMQEISKSLFARLIEKNSSNPFFPMAASDLFASIVISMIRSGAKPNNYDIKSILESSSIEDLRKMLGSHSDLASVASYIGGKAGSQAQGVLSEMYSVTRDVFMGVFGESGDFSMRQFIRNRGGKTAFIEYDLAIGDILSPVYTLLFDLALKEALGRTPKPGSDHDQGNVYLIADELKLLPNLRHLEDGINFGRSLGVKILAGLQSINQLNANYDNENKAKNAVSGFSSVIAFRQNDTETREYISHLMGKNMIFETFQEADGKSHYEKREGFTVEDWDLVDLDVGDAVVKLPSTKPFLFHFDDYNSKGGR